MMRIMRKWGWQNIIVYNKEWGWSFVFFQSGKGTKGTKVTKVVKSQEHMKGQKRSTSVFFKCYMSLLILEHSYKSTHNCKTARTTMQKVLPFCDEYPIFIFTKMIWNNFSFYLKIHWLLHWFESRQKIMKLTIICHDF